MLRRVVSPSCAAVAAAASQQRSISSYKFGQTPLTQPFPAGNKGPSAAAAASSTTAGKVTVTKLHNGARVITQHLGGPQVSVGAYIQAGPVYDPAGCPGAGAMMHLALTTSNFNNALFQLDRNIRSVGAAQVHFEKYKHYVGIRVDCREDKWRVAQKTGPTTNASASQPQDGISLVQDNIFTCIAAPRFHETDIERFRDTIDNQLKELRWQYPAEYAIQQLETVAFYREPLGNPRFVPENNNSHISSKVLMDQYSKYIVPSRVVIAGVNVDHAALIAEYENTPYTHSATAPHHAKVTATAVDARDEAKQYTGGERHDHEDRAKEMGTKPDMDTESIIAVGWLGFGRSHTSLKQYAASMVVKNMLDMTFHDGIRYVRDETHVHTGLRAFYNPYETAGLLGFTATAEPQHAVKMVTDTVKSVKDLKQKSASLLEAAKGRAVTQFLSEHSDNIRDYCDFLGTSLPLAGAGSETTPVRLMEVADAIKSVGAPEVQQVFDRMFSQGASLYGHGEVLGFPSLRQMGL